MICGVLNHNTKICEKYSYVLTMILKITVYSYWHLLNSTFQMGVSLNDTNNTGVTGIERVVPMCTEEIACLDLGFGRPVLSCLKEQ